MKRQSLTVEKRELLGKGVKKLRRDGVLPANIFGKNFESTAVQVPTKEFIDVYKVAHETGLVDIAYAGETIPVLIHNVQIDPRTQNPVHADFFKVNLKEKTIAYVPIEAVGEAPAVQDKLGVLLQQLSELEIEALPTDIPEKIEANIEGLTEVGSQVTVGDLKAPANITFVTDAGQTVFRIGELVQEEPEEEVPVEGEEGAEGETPAEGEEAPAAEGEEAPAEEAKE